MQSTTSSPPIDTVLAKLPDAQRDGDGWKARCPAHDDHTPSLSINIGDDDRVLVKCWAGCSFDAVVNAMGMTKRDLFTPATVPHQRQRPNPKDKPSFPTWEQAIAAYSVKLGLPAKAFGYHDRDGKMVGVIGRWNKPDGSKEIRPIRLNCSGWLQEAMPEPRPPYGLPDVIAATGRIYIVEGEGCADAALRIGLTATTSPHGSKSAAKADWSVLAGKSEIVLMPDNDAAGEQYVADIIEIVSRLTSPPRIKILRLAGLPPGGDIVDWLDQRDATEPDDLRRQIEALADAAEVVRTPTPQAKAKSTPRRILAPGDRVKCGDRGNIGTVVSDYGGDTIEVHFVSREGDEATKDIPAAEVTLVDGSPVVSDGFKLNLISSREFAAADYRQKFLIRHVLTAQQPCIVGGPQKGMKTGVMIEMAVSLGSATPFLGREDFAVKEAVNVIVISGESGPATLQETARRICFEHKVELPDCKIWWEERLPKIANPEHRDALRAAIRECDAKVCFLDPAYLCLLSGDTQGRQASNVFDMGSVLQGLADVGRDTGCGIVLAHHTRKNPAEKFAIPDLTELAYAGFGEFARQWLLLNRRSEYEPGRHELWLSIGGSAGHSSCWSLDIDEGVPDEFFNGRYWHTTVRSATEAIQRKRDDRAHQKENDRSSRLLADIERLADLLRDATEPMTKNEIRDRLGLNDKNFKAAFAEILKRNLLDQTTKKAGNGQSYDAFTFHSDTRTSE